MVIIIIIIIIIRPIIIIITMTMMTKAQNFIGYFKRKTVRRKVAQQLNL
jgi:hypothetical protein